MTHTHSTYFHVETWQINVLILVAVCLVSACGGSTRTGEEVGPDSNRPENATVDQLNPEQSGIEQGAMAMTGTIIIEERNGKTIFDAFFSHNSVSALDTGSKEQAIDSDVCSVSVLQSNESPGLPIQLGAANGKADYAAVGTALTIESRVGQFEALLKQQRGDLTVYAPDARWQSVALPEDAALSFETDSIFAEQGLVEVPPLLPLIWLAPETGVMSNPATSLRWDASLDEQVRIKLRLSGIDFTDSENPVVVTVSCDLVDDGIFNLPVEFQRRLPDDDMGIVVYAVRERVQEIQVDDASLTVVQLSYPAPMQP